MEPHQEQNREQMHNEIKEFFSLQNGRIAALSEAIKKIHPAGVQYFYNGVQSADGIYLLAPLVYALTVQTLALKFAPDGKWYGDYKLNRHKSPYSPEKPIKARLFLNHAEMSITIGKETYLYIPLGAKGKRVAKVIKAESPQTFAQLLYARCVTDMLELLKDKAADLYELPIETQLSTCSQVFAKTSENLVLFAISGAYPELTPAYQKAYNEDMVATKKAHLEILKQNRKAQIEAHEAQQAQSEAGQAGSSEEIDGQ